ncbi:MAG: helix-turn-helix domain-containing protein, partial [Pseudomonas sp.]
MSKTPQRARDSYHVGNLAPQLLDAAREMLEEVGPTKLSLRAVSERVGVSSTAAYHHYANRAELIGQLAAQGFRELGIALRATDTDNSGLDKLRDASLAYFSFARANPALYQ